MKISSAGLTLIRQFEGFSPTPYRCPAGIWTIGYGHVLLPAEEGSLLRVDEAMAKTLLRGDVRHAERAVRRLIRTPLTQSQFDALVSFTFNLGAAALQRSSLRRSIHRREEGEVAQQWMRWVWGGGRKLAGLAKRRAAELRMYQAA